MPPPTSRLWPVISKCAHQGMSQLNARLATHKIMAWACKKDPPSDETTLLVLAANCLDSSTKQCTKHETTLVLRFLCSSQISRYSRQHLGDVMAWFFMSNNHMLLLVHLCINRPEQSSRHIKPRSVLFCSSSLQPQYREKLQAQIWLSTKDRQVCLLGLTLVRPKSSKSSTA